MAINGHKWPKIAKVAKNGNKITKIGRGGKKWLKILEHVWKQWKMALIAWKWLEITRSD